MKSENVVLVIGATGAIGRALSSGFVESGWRVVGVSRHEPSYDSLSSPESYVHLTGDVTAESAVPSIFYAARRIFGSLRSVVYTPALEPDVDVPLLSYPLSNWHRTMNIYASGFLSCLQQAARELPAGGHIVVLGSAVTRFDSKSLPPLFLGHYAAAKSALNELCKWGRREAHEKGLLLSRFSPSAVAVPFHQNAPSYRKPPAMVPLDYLTGRIVGAVQRGVEIDEDLVAMPDGVKIISA